MALIKCKNCGHMVSDKGAKCPKCGTPIQKVVEVAKPNEKEEKAVVEVESSKVETPKADKPTNERPKDDSPITDSSNLETNVHNKELFDEPQSSKKWKIVLLCSIVVIVAIIGAYFLWNGKVMAAYEMQDEPIYSEELVKYAESGDAVAQCDLGICYANGSGIAKDGYEAFKWFKLSAEQGHVGGMRNLGRCYFEGLGVEKNEDEGIKLFNLSAEQGDAEAQLYLGYCYAQGIGVSQNIDEALKWLKLSAEKGNSEGMFYLGCLYKDGIGVSQNRDEALRLWKDAAERGCENAKQALAQLEKSDNIKKKFVRFADVYVDLSDTQKKHINTNLLEVLKERGYEVYKEEKSSDYNEVYDQTINMIHYYLGLNMSYSGYWKATGSPCSGVDFFISDAPHAYAVIHFENSVDLEAFLADAEKAGFKKNEHKEWSRNSDYPYDFIEKIDDTTLECHSQYPH